MTEISETEPGQRAALQICLHVSVFVRPNAEPVPSSERVEQQKNEDVTSDFVLQLPPGPDDLVHVGVDQDLLLPGRDATVLLQCWESLQQVLLDQDVGRLHRLGASSPFEPV